MTEGRAARFIPAAVRGAAKAGLRRWGILTSGRRTLPDFLIIGTKRGGTTSMYNALQGHPHVASLFPEAQRIKGVHYFDQNFERGPDWYRSHFPTVARRLREERRLGGPFLAGDGSPYSLFHPLAAERAAELVPDVKLIVQLRDPVERAWSHYRERVRHEAEPLSFDEAIDAEPERLRGEEERIVAEAPRYQSYAHENWSYVAHGIYAPQLERWQGLFPSERFLILRSEDLFEDFAGAYARVLQFLGLPSFTPERFRRFNYHPSDGMSSPTRRRLKEYFAPHNDRLRRLLGRDLGWSS
jgi:sulfotransferase family protein